MKRLKESRAASFVILFLVYAIATAIGIVVYQRLKLVMWLKLLIADVVATVATYIFSLIFNNASVYDPYWSVQPVVIVVAFLVKSTVSVAGVLAVVAIVIWGVRLTANWAYTFHGLKYEDWRYVMLKEKTGVLYQFVNFTGIHMVPTLVVYGCTLPAVYIIQSGVTAGVLSYVFFLMSVGVVILQGTADIQMHRFRKNRTSRFIRTGVWKYSRHPNYLAEILMWWSVAGASMSVMPDKWWLCIGAVSCTLLFLCVSIPLADGKQSKKEGFNEYKRETRMLLPIPRRM